MRNFSRYPLRKSKVRSSALPKVHSLQSVLICIKLIQIKAAPLDDRKEYFVETICPCKVHGIFFVKRILKKGAIECQPFDRVLYTK